jgi:hypothetical protein
MLRTKRIVLLLLMVSPFIFSSAWAYERINKPKIIAINGTLLANDYVVDSIIKNLNSTGVKVEKNDKEIEIPEENPLLQKIKALCDQAKTQVATNMKNSWVWDSDKNVGVIFDSVKNLIVSITIVE